MIYVQIPDEFIGAKLTLYTLLGTAAMPESTTGALDVTALAGGMYSMRIILPNGDLARWVG